MKIKTFLLYAMTIGLLLAIYINVPPLEVNAQSGQPIDAVGLEWSPDGTRIAYGRRAGTVYIRDVATGQILHTLSGHSDSVISLAWNTTGDRLASTGLDKTVRIWNTVNGSLIYTLVGHTSSGLVVIWNSDGTKIISNDSDEQPKMRVWNPSNGQLIQELPGGSDVKMAWSPNGGSLATANAGGSVVLRDSSTLAVTSFLQNPERGGLGFDVYQVAWHPSGTQIASGSLNGTVRIWDIATQQILLTLDANDSEMSYPDYLSQVRALTFSSDGSKLLSFSADGTVRVWGSTSGTLLAEQQQGVPIYAAAFSPDGSQLAYGAAGGTVEIVPVPGAAPENGRLAFFSNRDGDWEIYSMNPDGTGLLQLTHNTVADTVADRSPDGRVLAAQLRAARAIPDS